MMFPDLGTVKVHCDAMSYTKELYMSLELCALHANDPRCGAVNSSDKPCCNKLNLLVIDICGQIVVVMLCALNVT